ncbi:hypothetical protein [Oceanospirillum linum]|uniref:Internalin n=1 Tax=Oceanospirillum linum TaxID=966 RepID=A0A1T1H9G8_OCELI|nr:hypothetical protein [Oceanospirillum linum]OOV86416.1 hypothetical protein BTA35_0212920 [Oceanospirillum linum]SEG32714.1 hypothetical protein SAMN04489856_10839 [Oleiphilus messinensis]SMP28784.1 hypothetical protein SAMN06264348_10739 [Oceanospirillum linum]
MSRSTRSVLFFTFFTTVLLNGCAGIQSTGKQSVSIEQIPFRDENFKACVLEQKISDPAEITELDCSLRNIQSADELFYFPNLQKLDLSLNEISWLDIRANSQLESLKLFPSNHLKAMKFSHYPQLRTLALDGRDGEIAEDALQAMPALEELTLGFEDMTKLKIHQSELRSLSLLNSKSLNKLILNTPSLEDFYSDRSQLNWLDFSSTQKLVNLEIRKTPLQKLTLDTQPDLEKLWLQEGNLTTIELGSTPKLKQLAIRHQQLKAIDLSQAPNIRELELNNNRLTALDLNGLRQLNRLNVKNNPLPDLYKALGNSSLFLYCIDANQLDYTVEVFSLDCRVGRDIEPHAFKVLSNIRSLKLRLSPGVEQLNLSHLSGLESLVIHSQKQALKKVLLPSSRYLANIDLSNNLLKSITLPTLPKLQKLNLRENNLTGFKLSAQPQLKQLRLTGNPLKHAQFAAQPNLEALFINQTAIKKLQLTNQPKLKKLVLSKGKFEKLKLDLPELKELDLRWNPNLKKEEMQISPATKMSLTPTKNEAGHYPLSPPPIASN